MRSACRAGIPSRPVSPSPTSPHLLLVFLCFVLGFALREVGLGVAAEHPVGAGEERAEGRLGELELEGGFLVAQAVEVAGDDLLAEGGPERVDVLPRGEARLEAGQR